MSSYRIYFRSSGNIAGRENFEADDDVAAIRIARVLYDACSDVCDCFELWQGTRHIRTRQPHHGNARLAALIEAQQHLTVEVELRIRDGKWTIAKSERLIEIVDYWMASVKSGGLPSARIPDVTSSGVTAADETDLEMARRHVRGAEGCVARQREITVRLPQDSELRKTAELLAAG